DVAAAVVRRLGAVAERVGDDAGVAARVVVAEGRGVPVGVGGLGELPEPVVFVPGGVVAFLVALDALGVGDGGEVAGVVVAEAPAAALGAGALDQFGDVAVLTCGVGELGRRAVVFDRLGVPDLQRVAGLLVVLPC